MIEAYIKMWVNLSDFSGRSTRSDYWLAILASLVIAIVLVILAIFIPFFNFVLSVVSIITIIPGPALSVRRLHDIGKSGWWLLITLIPVIGGLVIFYLATLDSDPDNEYGPDPKEIQ